MEEREAILRRWFSMWLEGKDQGIAALFQEDALYIESWGPQYQGVEKIKHWFTEWNTRGRVLRWDMGVCFHRAQETMVTWRFHCRMDDGTEQAFEGVSYVLWSSEGPHPASAGIWLQRKAVRSLRTGCGTCLPGADNPLVLTRRYKRGQRHLPPFIV